MARFDRSQVTRVSDRRPAPVAGVVRVLLDVDGVINADRPAHATATTEVVVVEGVGYRVRIGDRVESALRQWSAHPGVDLRWCTTWQSHANTALAPEFALPILPVEVGDTNHHEWKFAHARAAVREGVPLVWLDDTEATPAAVHALAQEGPAPVLGIAPDPDRGLTGTHLELVTQFITDTTSPPALSP